MTDRQQEDTGAELRGIEETLARERRLLRTLIDNLPDYVYAKDARGRFLLNNAAHLRELGLARQEEAHGKTDSDFFPPELAAQYAADEQEVMRADKPLIGREETAVDRQGNTQWIETTKVPLHDNTGAVAGIVGMSRDVTARRVAELALQRQVKLQAMVATLSSHFIDITLSEIDGAILHALKIMGEYTGVDRAWVLGQRGTGKLMDCTHEWCAPGIASAKDVRKEIDPAESLAWASRQTSLGAVPVPDVSGLPEHAAADQALFQAQGVRSLLLAPMSSQGQRVGYLLLDRLDSTGPWDDAAVLLIEAMARIFVNALSRKRHQEAFEHEHSLLAALMDNIPDAIYFKDRDSRFLRISKAQADLFGLPGTAEGEGLSDFDFFTEFHARQAYEDEQEIIRTGTPVVGKIEKETWPDRPVSWVSTTKMPLRNAAGETIGTFGISRNVTERKLMEQALEHHAALLETANEELKARNQELDEFTYIASHDLQEPLRKLTAFSDILREDMKSGEEKDILHDLDVLAGAALRMQTLVQDLLALSRSGRQSMKIQEIEIDHVIEMALDTLEFRIAEARGEIVRGPMPRISGDASLLAQLFQNLIGNALKFKKDATPRVEINAEQQKSGIWLFSVRDNGIGLKPEYAEQIFSPFKRLHGRGEFEGTGIGLAICRKIAERHGGKIWVESELGKGACFKFTLATPAEEDEA